MKGATSSAQAKRLPAAATQRNARPRRTEARRDVRSDAPPRDQDEGSRGEKRGEVVVVLGAAVWAGGVASPALQRRVIHGVLQMKARNADALLMTGGLGLYPPTEARVMAGIARRMGVAKDEILLEENATTTRESAAFCAAIIAQRGYRDVLLVSDRYHLRRARLAFRWQGIEARGSAPPVDASSLSLERRATRALREWIGIAWYRLRGPGEHE